MNGLYCAAIVLTTLCLGGIQAASKGKKFVPPGFTSHKQWRECHGIKPDIYYPLVEKIKAIKVLLAVEAGRVPQNKSEMNEYIGDVLLTRFQADELMTKLQSRLKARRHKRKLVDFVKMSHKKWNLPIRYQIEDLDYTTIQKSTIKSGLQHWSDRTCITFEELAPGALLEEQSLYILADNGCHSDVGMVPVDEGNPQQLVASSGCFDGIGTFVHEMGHALGFWHEHERYDRDQYITINSGNVQDDKQDDFSLGTNDDQETYDIPYDYSSVMHYNRKEFSKSSSLVTITTKDPLYSNTIGQDVELSFYDAKMANKAYCDDVCPTKLACKHDGYTDPKDCSKCRCPDGMGGTLCDQAVTQGSDLCSPASGAITVGTSEAGKETCIKSPGYDLGSYNDKESCNWWLQAPHNCKIELYFKGDFNVYCDDRSGDSCFHWVEIKYKNGLKGSGPRFCCNKKPDFNGAEKLVTTGNSTVVTFRSHYNTAGIVQALKGFQLCYKLQNEECLDPKWGEPVDDSGNSGVSSIRSVLSLNVVLVLWGALAANARW